MRKYNGQIIDSSMEETIKALQTEVSMLTNRVFLLERKIEEHEKELQKYKNLGVGEL